MKNRRIMWPTILIGMAVIIYAIYSFFSSFGYEITADRVVYEYYDNANFKRAIRQMPDADPKTFVSFGSHKEYGKDAHKVYLKGITVQGADPTTFEIIDQKNDYTRDANYIYWYNRRISDRPSHFTSMGNGYSKDDQFVFKGGAVVKEADPKTFEFLDERGYLSKDAKVIFVNGKILEGSHSPSFENIAFDYYRDRNNVYHRAKKIIGAVPNTIEVLGKRYVKDTFFAYYEAKRILDADPASFEIVLSKEGDFYAQDKYRKYIYGKEVEAFPEPLSAEVN